ncbi:MAG TPA: MFS transporter [Gemmataceae bacterium]|nr:MFS transporter [Gemmataceae bacterium]
MTQSIATARDRHIRYWVLAALCLITAINYIQRNSLGGIETTVRAAFRLTDKTLTSEAQSAFFFSYALCQIPSGWLAQRWGPRKALSLYALGWSTVALLMGLSPGMYVMIGLQVLMGAFQAGIFPCATLIMATWIPRTRRALASGLLTAFMYAGGALVFNLTGLFLHPLNRLGEITNFDSSFANFLNLPSSPVGWRFLLVLYAIPGIALAVVFYLWFRDRPEVHPQVTKTELEVISAGRDEVHSSPKSSFPVPWLAIALSLAMWMLCTQQFFRAGAIRFVDKWLPTYLQDVSLREVQDPDERKAEASHLASFPLYAGMFGGLIGGGVSDWVLRRTGQRRAGRNGVAVASLLLTILCTLPIFWFHNAGVQVALFCVGSFLASGVNSCAYAMSMDVGGKNLGVIFSTMNMLGNFGSMTLTLVFGLVSDRFGWNASLRVFVAAQLIAIVCWLFLNPNRNIGEEQEPLAT